MIDRPDETGSIAAPDFDVLKEQAMVYAADASERLAEGRDQLRESIVNNPARALGIAFGMGVLLGWLVKRR